MTGTSYERALADAGVTLEELTRLEAAATKAPWETDACKSEGSYGSGPSCREGYDAQQMLGPHGKVIFDSLNSDAACVHEEYGEDGGDAWDDVAKRDFAFIAAARNALPALLAGCREADDQRARATRAVAEDEALRVERDEARAEFEELLSEWDDYEKKFRAAEAALAEAQRQAAEAERAGWIKGRDAAAAIAAYVRQADYVRSLSSTEAAARIQSAIYALAPPSAPGSAETEGDKP